MLKKQLAVVGGGVAEHQIAYDLRDSFPVTLIDPEGPVIMQWLADQKPLSELAPKLGSHERYRLLEMLGYINSDIHKTFSQLFKPSLSDTARSEAIDILHKRYHLVEKRLEHHEFMVGDRFSIADAYLFTVSNWAGRLDVDLTPFKRVASFQRRIGARPAVQTALKAEGLIG